MNRISFLVNYLIGISFQIVLSMRIEDDESMY